MPTEQQIIAAADKAMASLTTYHTQISLMKAVAKLCKKLSKPVIIEALPELCDFIAKGISPQKAAKAILSTASIHRRVGIRLANELVGEPERVYWSYVKGYETLPARIAG
jgi:hypothetical protein